MYEKYIKIDIIFFIYLKTLKWEWDEKKVECIVYYK